MLGRLHLSKKIRGGFTKSMRSFDLIIKHIRSFHAERKYARSLRSRMALLSIAGLVVGGVLVAIFLLKGNNASANWYNDNWGYRRKITIDHTKVSGSTNLTDFPVLISFTSDTNLSSNVNSDGSDIIFTDSVGKKLNHEIEYYSSGTLSAWVKISSLSPTTDTTIYMYYGNSDASNQQNITSVWASDYRGVWHLSETSGQHLDSTSNNNDSTTINVTTQGSATGKIGGADDFASGNEVIIADSNSLDISSSFTAQAWVKADTINASTYHSIIYKGGNSNYYLELYDSNEIDAGFYGGGDWRSAVTSNSPVGTGTYYHVAVVHDAANDTIKTYVNGVEKSSVSSITQTPLVNTSTFTIGENFYNETFDGIIDEVRLSDSAKSAAWLLTEYNNQNSPSTFYSSGYAEERTRGPSAYWKFDEGYGTAVNDSSGNSQIGTLGTGSSAPTWRSEEFCQNGSCLQFDGSDDDIQWADSSSLDIENELTISLWVKPITLQSSTYYTLVYKGNSTNEANYYFQLYGDELNFGTYESGWKGTSTTNADIQTNQWSHVVVTYSDASDDIDFYVNGILKSDDGFSHDLVLSADNQPFYLGSSAADLEFYDGFIDEVKIYPYVRSADEIKQDYLFSGAKGAAAVLGTQDQSFLSEGLVGYWKMDETTGTTGPSWTALDSSGNSNNGTGAGDAGQATGKFGNAASFDGTDDSILIPSTDIPIQDFTYAFWVLDQNVSDNNGILSVSNGTANELRISFDDDSEVLVSMNSEFFIYSDTNTVPSNLWIHLALSRIGNDVKLYKNGEVIASGTNSSTLDFGSCDLYVGVGIESGCDGTYIGFDGKIDELRIYKRGLTQSEVKSLYQWAPGPVIYYDFDQGTGTTAVNDRSGNGRSGSMHNFSNSNWKDGKYGKGLLFDGSSSYIGITSPSLPTTDFTYSFWANFKDIAVGGNEAVLDTGGNEFTVIITDGSFDIHTNGSWRTYTPTNVTTNTWNYVTVSRSGSTISVYLNGKLENTATDGTAFDFSTCELLIGVDANSGCNASLADYSNLVMDDLKIYNYARTSDQIIQDMNAGHPLIGTPVGTSVLHMKFDEGYDSTAHDSSPERNDGDLGASTAAPAWSNDGKLGKSLYFDNSNDYVEVSDDDSLDFVDGSNFSISSWVKIPTLADNNVIIAKKQGNTAGLAGYMMFVNSSGQVAVYIADGTDQVYKFTSSTMSANQWTHILLNYEDDTALTIYINGQDAGGTLNGTIANVDSIANSNVLRVGTESDGDLPFSGYIDEVSIYPFALTSDQIKTIMNGGKTLVLGAKSTGVGGSAPSNSADRAYCIPGDASTCNAPIAEWNMDDGVVGASKTIADTSGNGNSGTTQSSNGTGMNCTTPGKFGKGCTLDGTDDYIQVTDPGTGSILDFSSGDPITVEVWIKPTALPSLGTYRTFLTKGGISDGQLNYLLEIGNVGGSGIFDFCYSTTGFAYNCYEPSGTVLDVGKWQHIAMTYTFGTGSSMKLYKNGQIVSGSWTSNDGNAAPAETNQDLWIGGDGTPSRFNGSMDGVKIYDYTRTPAQIAWDYDRGAPVAWYKMDECQGTAIYNAALNGDGKAAGNNGTLTIGASGEDTIGNCSTSSTAWGSGASGKINSSLDFDGTDDYIDMGDPSSGIFDPGTGDYSVSVWMKGGTQTNTASRLVFKYQAIHVNANHTGICANKISFEKPSGGAGVCSTSDVNDNAWHLVTAVRKGDNAYVYIDGKLENSQAGWSSEDATTNYSLTIGGYPSANHYFDGQIDDVRIYRYALTADQVKQVYTNGAVSFK